jgi:type I restriction enzyme, S subunit
MIEQLEEMPKYEAYKDSGVEWLGEIPEHWKPQKLKFNSELRVSNVDKHSKKLELPVKLANYVDVYKNNFITDSIEFMEVTANQEEIERFSIQIDDVLITKDSEDWLDIGVPALVKHQEKNLLCGYHLAIIRSKSNAMGCFVFWALLAHYNRIQFSVKANGVTRFGISHGAIKNNWVALPPLSEQTAIAAFLDYKTAQIDQAVAIKEQQIALLKERKQILIQNAVTRGLDPNAPMRDSGVEWIGEIPAHWKIHRLKRFAQLNPSVGLVNRKSCDLVCFLPMENVGSDGIVDYSNKQEIRLVSQGFTQFRRDDVLIAKITPCFENGK